MAPLDVLQPIPVSAAEEFDRWLRDHGTSQPRRILAIHKEASGKQTVTFKELLDTALCHGRVDTQTKRIDEERYAIASSPAAPAGPGRPPTAHGCGASGARLA